MCILAHWSKKTASYVKNTEDIWEGIKAWHKKKQSQMVVDIAVTIGTFTFQWNI
jgi:superoxide dismutase